MKKWIEHQLLHLAMAACLFLAGIIFKSLHDRHRPQNPPLSL